MSAARGEGSRPADRHGATVEESETARRLLVGALTAVSQLGTHKLSPRDIASRAGVSKTTFYRYFSSRDAALESAGEYVRKRWDALLLETIEAEPDPAQRVRLVIQSVLSMAEVVPESKAIFEVNPEWAFSYLQRHFPDFRNAAARALEPALSSVEAVRSRVVTGAELSEIVLRIAMSGFLVPGRGTVTLPGQVDAFWSVVSGISPGRNEASSTAPVRPHLRLV
jgi:AcrR family transcriptional regulator